MTPDSTEVSFMLPNRRPQKGPDMTVDSATTRETNKQAWRRAMSGITALDVDAIQAELHDAPVVSA